MADKKVYTYQVKIDGLDRALQQINGVERALERLSAKAESRGMGSFIASAFGSPADLDRIAGRVRNITDNVKRLNSETSLGSIANVRLRSGRAPIDSRDVLPLVSGMNGGSTPPAILPGEQRLARSMGRTIPVLSYSQISDRDLARQAGIAFDRFLPQVAAQFTKATAKAVEDELRRRIAAPVTSKSGAQIYGLNFARDYVALAGGVPYGSMRLRNPSGLSPWESAFLGDINRSPYPITSTQLAWGHVLRSPLGAVKPPTAGNMTPQVWQHATDIMGMLQRRGLADRLFRSVQLHPVSTLMYPSAQIEAAMNQTAYRPHIITELGSQMAAAMGFNKFPGWGSVGSALPHRVAHPVSAYDVKPLAIRSSGMNDPAKYVSYSGMGGISLLPWTESLADVAAQYRGGAFAKNIDEPLLAMLQGAYRPPGRIHYHDLSTTDIGFGQYLGAIGSPDFVYGGPTTTGQRLVRRYMPQREQFASSAMGSRAYDQYMMNFFTNPRLFSTLGSRGQAAEYAGALGGFLPGFASRGGSSDSVIKLANTLTNLTEVAFPELIHNAQIGQEEAAAKFVSVIGGPEAIDSLAETIGTAWERSIKNYDVTTQLRPGLEIGPGQSAMFNTMVPYMLSAFDRLVDWQRTGKQPYYSSEPMSSIRSRAHGFTSSELRGLTGEDLFSEGEEIPRTHARAIPPDRTPVSREQPHKYIDWSKGAVTRERYAMAKHIASITGGSPWDIMMSMNRTGASESWMAAIQRDEDRRAAEEAELYPGFFGTEKAITGEGNEPITPEEEHALRTGGSGAILGYQGGADKYAPTEISTAGTTPVKRRPKIPRRASLLNRIIEITSQGRNKFGAYLPLIAGLGAAAIGHAIFPGFGGAFGLPFAMMGVTMEDRGGWNDFLSGYMATNGPPPEDDASKQEYYRKAREQFEGTFAAESAAGAGAGASQPAGNVGAGAQSNAAAKTQTLRMSDKWKLLAQMGRVHTPGATGMRWSVEAQYPMEKLSKSEVDKALQNISDTQTQLQGLGQGIKVFSKVSTRTLGGRATQTAYIMAQGKLGFENPAAVEQFAMNLGSIIDASKATQTFVDKVELIGGVAKGQARSIGITTGTYGAGPGGSTNIMAVRGKFEFPSDRIGQIDQVRESLKSLDKDMVVSEYTTKKLNDAGEEEAKTYLEVDQAIPLKKSNEFGASIEKTVEGIRNQTVGIDGSIDALRGYNENVLKSSTFTEKLGSMGMIMKRLAWNFTMVSLSALGVYFSMLGLINLVKTGITTLVSPLTNLSSMVEQYGLAQAFATQTGIDMNQYMQKSGVTLEDMTTAWMKVTGLMADFNTGLAILAANVMKNPETWGKITEAVRSLVEWMSKPETAKQVADAIGAIAEAIPTIVESLPTFIEFLKLLAQTKWPSWMPLVGGQSLGGEMVVGSLAAQFAMPITSMISAGVGIFGTLAMRNQLAQMAELLTGGGTGAAGGVGGAASGAAAEEAVVAGGSGAAGAAGAGTTVSGAAGALGLIGAVAGLEETARTLYNYNQDQITTVKPMLEKMDMGWAGSLMDFAQYASTLPLRVTSGNMFGPTQLDIMNELTGGKTLWDMLFPSEDKAKAAAATNTTQEANVKQDINITYNIQGDFDKNTATKSEDLLTTLLKLYGKGTTPGGGS
jgi:hypothetical protein